MASKKASGHAASSECLKRGDMSICAIAFLLGVSEQSSFNHRFKGWLGLPPGEYAARLRS